MLGAESSLGDPRLGGVVTSWGFNFGSIKWRPRTALNAWWWDVSTGKPMEGERLGSGPWMAFPSADQGMEAWGRFISGSQEGRYITWLTGGRWREFAAVYFGLDTSGFDEYVARLEALATRFRTLAQEAHVEW